MHCWPPAVLGFVHRCVTFKHVRYAIKFYEESSDFESGHLKWQMLCFVGEIRVPLQHWTAVLSIGICMRTSNFSVHFLRVFCLCSLVLCVALVVEFFSLPCVVTSRIKCLCGVRCSWPDVVCIIARVSSSSVPSMYHECWWMLSPLLLLILTFLPCIHIPGPTVIMVFWFQVFQLLLSGQFLERNFWIVGHFAWSCVTV